MKKQTHLKAVLIIEHVAQTVGITPEKLKSRSIAHNGDNWPRKLAQTLISDILDKEVTLAENGSLTSNSEPFDPATVHNNIRDIREEMKSEPKKWELFCKLKAEIQARIEIEIFDIEPKLAQWLKWVRTLETLEKIQEQIDLILKNV